MGKKLRTRSLLSDTDSESDNDVTTLPIIGAISSSTIIKKVRSKLSLNSASYLQKTNSKSDFIPRVQNQNGKQRNGRAHAIYSIRVSYLPVIAGEPYDDGLRTCLLFPLSLVQRCLQ